MPNLIENLQRIMRMNNVFGESASTPPFVPETFNADSEDYGDITGLINKMYTPETKASNQFNEMLGQYPERNKPGIMRRIGAGLIGLEGGPEAAEKFMYQPFERKLVDWKAKIGPAQAAMTQERLGNVNERTLALQTAANTIRERANTNKANLDAKKLEVQ